MKQRRPINSVDGHLVQQIKPLRHGDCCDDLPYKNAVQKKWGQVPSFLSFYLRIRLFAASFFDDSSMSSESSTVLLYKCITILLHYSITYTG